MTLMSRLKTHYKPAQAKYTIVPRFYRVGVPTVAVVDPDARIHLVRDYGTGPSWTNRAATLPADIRRQAETTLTR